MIIFYIDINNSGKFAFGVHFVRVYSRLSLRFVHLDLSTSQAAVFATKLAI